MHNKIYILGLGVLIVFILTYFLFVYKIPTTNNNINSEEITYGSCASCSTGVINIINSLFNSQNAPLKTKNISFNSKLGVSFVSNFSVTALPSLILNETSASTNVIDSLVYLNAFNVGSNYFVLNTPFIAGISKGVRYFDLIQNRTITAFDIFNQSYIYKNANRSVINPSEVLYMVNGTNKAYKNKTEISFVYGNSSFSAVQSLILYKALKGFGNFTNLSTLTSVEVAFSPGKYLGNTEFYALKSSDYRSNYFYFESSYLNNLSTSPYIGTLERQLFEFDQNAAYPLFSNVGNFLPFIDIGGRYIEVSSMINPKIFYGKTINQIDQLVNTNETIGLAFNDSVHFMQTILCSYVGYTAYPCNSTVIKSDLVNINSLT